MLLANSSQMQMIDKKAMENIGMPGIVLMENAGKVVFDEIVHMKDKFDRVIILAGPGNNGGDGFVIARHLHNVKIPVRVFIIGKATHVEGDALANLNILKKLSIQIDEVFDGGGFVKLEKSIRQGALLVDAIFGTGLTKPVHGIFSEVIDLVNEMADYILSVDIPSGIDSDTGKVMGTAIEADKTVSLVIPKIGNIMYPGSDYNGELVIKGIGVPDIVIEDTKIEYNIITSEVIERMIPHRKRNTNKGDYGKGNIIAGSTGLTGAAILACKAALRSGMGLLKLYIPESLNIIITTAVPETVTVPLIEVRKGVIGINNFNKVIEESNKSDVLAIGPGCGLNAEVGELLKRIIFEVHKPLVIDADGLNALAKNVHWLESKKSDIIITPHPGEMSRLCGQTVEEVNDNPIETALSFSKEWGVITVLKGSRTVIATPSGEVFINVNGNPGMATAGSGDILTGVITSFIAQGFKPIDAAVFGVYIHGMAGDIMAESRGEHGLLAGDIVEGITRALKVLAGR